MYVNDVERRIGENDSRLGNNRMVTCDILLFSEHNSHCLGYKDYGRLRPMEIEK